MQSGLARRRSICGRPQGGRVRVDRLGIGSRPGMRINCLTDIRCWNKHHAASRSRFAVTGLPGSGGSQAAATGQTRPHKRIRRPQGSEPVRSATLRLSLNAAIVPAASFGRIDVVYNLQNMRVTAGEGALGTLPLKPKACAYSIRLGFAPC